MAQGAQVYETLTMYCTELLSLLLLLPASFTLAGNRAAAPPYFDKDPTTHMLALEGARAKLVCKARGSPKPSLLWYKGRDIIAREDRIRISKYALHINPVVTSDEGVYRCEASNEHGKKWVNYTFSVVAPPHFRRDPHTTLLAYEGEEVKFRCKALGRPRPHVFWYKGNDLVGLNDRINASKYALHINRVAKSDEGVYRCEASNEYGKKWVNYTLSVEDATTQSTMQLTYTRNSSTIGVNSGRLIYHDPAFIGGISAVFIVAIFAIVLLAILWRRYKKRKGEPAQAVDTSGTHDVEPIDTGTFSCLNLDGIPVTTIPAANTPLISSYISQPPPMTAPAGATIPLLSSSSNKSIHTRIPPGATIPLLSSSSNKSIHTRIPPGATTPLLSSSSNKSIHTRIPPGATTPILSSSSNKSIHTRIPPGATIPLISSSDL